jgi:hypothetical protein
MQIDKQIAALKRKRLKLQKDQAIIMLKKLKRIFGKEYSSELIYAIVYTTWQNANRQEKEVWRSNAHPFRHFDHDKAIQAGTKDPKQTDWSSAKKVSPHDESKIHIS